MVSKTRCCAVKIGGLPQGDSGKVRLGEKPISL